MTTRQVIEANVQIGKPKITSRTVNRYLTAWGAFCDWPVRNDDLDVNPVAGLLQTIDEHKRSTLPFPVEQMSTLFGSPLFTGCRNDSDWHLAPHRRSHWR
jgi:site-specific recombinase XerC